MCIRDSNEPARVLTGDNALGITIEHSQSYLTYFDWDAAAGKYLMLSLIHIYQSWYTMIN